MDFIDNMKMGKKLLGGFLIVIIILVAVSALAYVNLQTLSANSASMYNDQLMPISQLKSADTDLWTIRGDVYKAILVPEERDAAIKSFETKIADSDKLMDKYRASDLSQEEKTILAKYDADWATYKTEVNKITAVLRSGDTRTALALVAANTPVANARLKTSADIDQLVTLNEKAANDLKKKSDKDAADASLIIIVATIIAIIAGIAIALYLTKSITGPIELVRKNIREIHLGHLTNRMNLNRKDEIGEMAETMDRFADDLQKYVVGTLRMISEGDLSRNLKARDEKDEIVPALKTTIESIRALVAETTMLSAAGVQGRLATRGNADKFKGGYRDIVKGVNETLDAVVGPVNEAMRVSNEYAQGNFTARVDEKLNVQGDFIKFKDSLNNIGIEISKSMSVVNQQVSDLAASAEEANASVEEVSAGSAQVAKNASGVSVNSEKAMQGVEQVQKAMEDLSRTIQDVATKSEAVAKIVQDTTNFSREGMELAQKTEQGMQGITKSSNDVNQIIGEIKDQMDKISEIVNLITDLANQTNLLALNAAIEAARAGDAGRGFAVVATEVKSLAVESRASAERIAEMIDNLQKQTLNAVDAVSAANAGVKEGSEALHETLSSFNKIVTSIDRISQNVSEVAAAAEEQAASVEEVTASINEVGGLMRNTTSEATDAAAASEESSAAIDQITKVVANVNSIVDKVTKEVSRFRV